MLKVRVEHLEAHLGLRHTSCNHLVDMVDTHPPKGTQGPNPLLDDLEWVPSLNEPVVPTMSLVSAPPAWVRLVSADDTMPMSTSRMAKGPSVGEQDAQSSLTLPLEGNGKDAKKPSRDQSTRSIPSFGRVQVLLAAGWRDVSTCEMKQICDHLIAGEPRFTILARNNAYVIDFSNPDGATQTNMKSGKCRKLRILDAVIATRRISEEDEDADRSGSLSPRPNSSKFRPQQGHSANDSLERPKHSSKECYLEEQRQRDFGPQSKRGGASQHQLSVLDYSPHAKECFQTFAQNEEKLCDKWAVFYHSYSFAALIYEVQAAVGAVLFRFRSQYASLPRILVHEFSEAPDAQSLIARFESKFALDKRDHHPEYRKVAIAVMCSLVSLGPEVSTPLIFLKGYSEHDLSFRRVLENLLKSCYVPQSRIKKLADDVIALSEKHGLDVSQFGGRPCKSGKSGHLLQIFIKRSLVDRLAYAAAPYGIVDKDRHPISEWLNRDVNTNCGQARLVAHPKLFMQANCVRMHIASADPTFHSNRKVFQEQLTGMLDVILGEPLLRMRAATGIYGGTLPAWWTFEDQRGQRSRITSSACAARVESLPVQTPAA